MTVFSFLLFSFYIVGAAAASPTKDTTTLKLAGLFASSTGKEYICVTKAFREIAKDEGIDVTIDVIEHDNSISDLIQKAHFIVSQKYDVVIGPRTSQEAIATSPIFGAANIPQILPVASYQPPKNSAGRLAVSMVADSERYGALSARLILKHFKPKRILVVVNESQPYSTRYAELLPKQLNDLGYSGKLERAEYIEGYADYDKIAAQAKLFKPEIIYAPLYGMDIGNLYAALARADVSVVLFARAGIFELRDILKSQYSPKVKLIFNGIWDNTLRGPWRQQFRKMMLHSCKGIEIGVRAVTGFDSLRLLLETIKEKPGLRGEGLADALKSKPFSGLMGERRYDKKTSTLLLSMPVFEHDSDGFKLFEIVN